jgi:hypothetical protein
MSPRNWNSSPVRTYQGLILIAGVFLLVGATTTAPAHAAYPFCSASTTCRASSHFTLAQSTYPYTEDIDGSPSGVTLHGPTYTFTTIETSCSQLSGNLNGSASFNAHLRAQITIEPDSTAAVGARYEVQLQVDGVEHGWYVRRLRGQYPQVDVFAGTVQNVAAGNHVFSVVARLLDSGTLHIEGTYITAQGSPATYPSVKDVQSSAINISTSGYVAVSGTISFSNSVAVDLPIDGYFQINSGTFGQQIQLQVFLDGLPAGPYFYVGVPPNLYDGISVLSILTNVPAGNHYMTLLASTNNYNINVSNRELEFVGFPATTYYVFGSDSTLTAVQSNTTQAQPHPQSLDTSCGLWTKLLDTTVPRDPSTGPYFNSIYEGYIHFPGSSSDYTAPVAWGELAFETFYPDCGCTDGGSRSIQIPLANAGSGSPYPDGAFIFGDAGAFYENDEYETIRLWARKINASCNPANNGQQGAFNVSDRFLWMRHVTSAGSCFYQ